MLAKISSRSSLLETAYGKKLLDYLTGPQAADPSMTALFIITFGSNQIKTVGFAIFAPMGPHFSEKAKIFVKI